MDILLAIAIMALGAVVLGAALGYASIKFKVEGDPLVDKIEAILPQTQCGQCGYPGCKPYAEAIAKGEAEINLCPPGGMEGVQRLADLLGREVKPLDAEEKPKQVAIIDENTCIGCTLCIQACPVDAIIGAAKQLHVIIGPQCTGCELCLAFEGFFIVEEGLPELLKIRIAEKLSGSGLTLSKERSGIK